MRRSNSPHSLAANGVPHPRRRLIPAFIAAVSTRDGRRAAVALIFSLMLMPLLLVVALAIDFGFYVQAKAQLNLAADAAAMQAVRSAVIMYQGGSSTAGAITAGQRAGRQWFAAQVGTIGTATVVPNSLSVGLTYDPTNNGFSATVSYAASVATRVGSFMTPAWNVANTANAQSGYNHLEIVMMLDNSSSMQIGATYSDQQHLMQLTACGNWTEPYSHYQCGTANGTYAAMGGQIACPLPAPAGYPFSRFPIIPLGSDAQNPQSCAGITPTFPNNPNITMSATMNMPCMFACHSDTSKPAGTGNDYYGIARSTIGSANPITLRFDLLKIATNQVLNMMATTYLVSQSLSVGIFTFNTMLNRVYPASGEAGADFPAAMAAVGSPPTQPNQPDTGIQPESLYSQFSNTNFAGAMDTLAQTVTASGNGAAAATPRKVLFLVTDGFQDYNSHADFGAFNVAKCTVFKNMGYQIYVIYTPAYPLMWTSWYDWAGAPVTSGAVEQALRDCSSGTSFYIQASDGPGLNAAMRTFLLSALNAPSRLVR